MTGGYIQQEVQLQTKATTADKDSNSNLNHRKVTKTQSDSCSNGLLTDTSSSTTWSTVSFNSLPPWMQDNQFILHHHRPPLGSMSSCWCSLFRLHSETGNIWTHLLGFLLFLVLWPIHISMIGSMFDKLLLSIFFVGACTCLGLSATYHTCSAHSPGVSHFCHQLDYVGISTLIYASFLPTIYYGFYGEGLVQLIYGGSISVIFILAVIVSLYPKFARPEFRSIRAAVFVVYGLSGVIPGIHWWFQLVPELYWSWGCLVTQGALYVLGAAFYAGRIPERLIPGSCDLIGQSHQIFHTLVVIAALVHLNGLHYLINYRLA